MSTPSLARLQRALQEFVLHDAADVHDYVRSTESSSAGARLDVYANAYRTRLTEALESNFPVLAKLMGGDEFRALARDYILRHDSTHRSVRWYGDRLAGFLGADERYRGAALLADLAAWEWAMTEVFDAADAPNVRLTDLAGLAPEAWSDLELLAHPSLRRLDLTWNAPQTWKALQGDAAAPAPECVSPPQPWLLWRRDLQLLFRSLDPVEAKAIDAVRAGETFGSLCSGISDLRGEEEAPQRAASLLHGWIEAGLISAIVAS
ncbi:MAG TPA: DNA-binding domain-containing protein [Steroidobacteraceae bacterium]|nr:DNA-binding domain-containing protein [Steroidobacteraceae bacterium]